MDGWIRNKKKGKGEGGNLEKLWMGMRQKGRKVKCYG